MHRKRAEVARRACETDGSHLEGHDLDSLDVARVIADELLGHDGILAWILAVALLHLVLPVVGAEDAGVGGPGIGDLVALHRRLVEQLQVDERLAPVAH